MRVLSLAPLGLLSLFHLATSQDLSSLPQCAQTCALSAISSTGCAVTDAHCICSASTFLSSVASCISTACSPADQQATLTFAQQYCLSGGVTITLPSSSAAGPTFTPAPTTTAPATISATTTSSYVAASGAPATYTGAAQILRQEWAGIMGVVGLGVAAVL
ncbi:uncharacterized protein Z518_05111 [Rhinocladiella mackenziei CBS 650.93]|uniref:CFEM domain-containing protein n=1 Tax=Rhinocladiella mackenziei CBS 650.93 TaxID=1442369 RepID=A0A0D2IMW9_9EURO|nr:uncharacterized protein Z518_05111 [Rhinocladiella mackenziei CBS 650.93]KIX07134.1 hypothetical protein Z518_05111 [Rhinocladiella mackenziei CBS 650.93]